MAVPAMPFQNMGETPMLLGMQVHKIAIKFFVQDESKLAGVEFVPIFHSWIQTQLVPDHMLIDVADYAHVQDGPGTVLVAHEANFYLDRNEGRVGLAYSRKQPAAGDFQTRLRQAVVAALEACMRLENDANLSGRLKFRTDEMLVRLNDRLLAPNTPETFDQMRGDLQEVLADLYGAADLRIEHKPSPATLFEVRIRASENSPVMELLSRLSTPAR
jgi:hypothetical protein